MQLVVFKAGDGDSLLVRGSQANILVDGGRKGAFTTHVAPFLEKMHEDQEVLDLVCVSHIDEDHISGILELYERRTAWAVHNLGNTPQPGFKEPPKIERLWHNAFETTVTSDGGNAAGEISNQLGFHEQLLTAGAAIANTAYGQTFRRIAQGARKAIELDLRFQQSPMNIVFNGPTGGELIQLTDGPLEETIKGIKVTLLTPFKEDLDRLRPEWDKWVNANKDKVREMQEQFSQQSGSTDPLDFLRFAATQAELGNFDDVTPPNRASITFMLEEDGQKFLMTGDHASQGAQVDSGDPMKRGILEGLEHAGLLAPGGGLHVNVLKVPHHGAEANTSIEFARRITADHYVFCSNGHRNPDLPVIKAYVNSRRGNDPQLLSQNPETANPFKMWFNYHPDDAEIADNEETREHLEDIRDATEALAGANHEVFDVEFSQASHFIIPQG